MTKGKCNLCNERRELIEGTFFKKLSSGGPVELCDECWDELDKPRCALCGTKVSDNPEENCTVTENNEESRGGISCRDCRRVLDWNVGV